jgi:hypothetical protein
MKWHEVLQNFANKNNVGLNLSRYRDPFSGYNFGRYMSINDHAYIDPTPREGNVKIQMTGKNWNADIIKAGSGDCYHWKIHWGSNFKETTGTLGRLVYELRCFCND